MTSTGITGTNKVTVASSNTLKADAQYLDGKTIDGAGNITVDTLNGDSAADLSGISTSGTNIIITNNDLTFTGKFIKANFDLSGGNVVTMTSDGIRTGKTVSVLTGNNLTAAASLVTGKTIGGAGTVNTTALESTPGLSADLSNITTTTLTGALNSTDDKEFLAAAKLSDAVITISGTGTVTANASATLPTGSGSFSVGENATLTLTAVHADGLTVSGAGKMNINTLSDSIVNLSSITTTGTTTLQMMLMNRHLEVVSLIRRLNWMAKKLIISSSAIQGSKCNDG